MTATMEFNEVLDRFIPRAAASVARRYARYGVLTADCASEIYVWVYDRGASKIRRWISNDPPQLMRCYMEMFSIAQRYAEKEKAARLGTSVSDQFWYSRAVVEELLPYAENLEWDGMLNSASDRYTVTKQNEDAIAMVCDIRRALAAGYVGVDAIVNFLGGITPYKGRTAISNAAAQASTGDAY